jgi:hypothetical protein
MATRSDKIDLVVKEIIYQGFTEDDIEDIMIEVERQRSENRS